MNQPLLRSTLRELQTILASSRLWLVFAAAVVLFTATGPFGTLDALALPARLGYWLIVQALTWSTALVFVAFFDALLESRLAHALPRMLVGAALSALPMGLVLLVVNAAFRASPLSLTEYVAGVLTALPVALVMCLLSWLALDGSRKEDAPEGARDMAAPAAPPRAPLLDRLPPEKRGALVRLEVQDHYVLAVTTRGSEMLLMRLADAIRETAPADGFQVHRSHWVARDGVVALEREPGKNGRSFLRMADGERVPVSRANAAGVKAWME
ncbi:LytTR family DNA-binding domain-containing protein [Zhengella sp. ZM62]|uniref:LytTR family DNA-binding domain-containing protein n=1 Tax=Zhengella sedimenti TaxID=3390035 RepID=UPI00397678FF